MNLIDINGDSTFVIPGNNDSYTVIGGNLNGLEDDTGIYIKNVDGTVTLVGNSITSYSFFGDDGNAVIGAIIYMSSNEGQNFVFNGIIKGHPSLISYMLNATGGGKYDFKTRGISNKPTGITLTQYMYRGSQTIIPPKN